MTYITISYPTVTNMMLYCDKTHQHPLYFSLKQAPILIFVNINDVISLHHVVTFHLYNLSFNICFKLQFI